MDEQEWSLDGHLIFACIWHATVALVGAMFTLLSPIAGYVGYTEDPDIAALGPVGAVMVYGLMGLVCFGVVAALNGLAVVGLLRRQRFGWWCSALASGLWLMGLCAPVGVYVLWALLREDVRRAYGIQT